MDICRRDFTRWMALGTPLALRGASNRPKLLVLVLLEQLRGDSLDLVTEQLGQNGLRKLLYKGTHFTDCRHLASTFPSTTVATLATGAWPAQHGIVADSWFENGTVATACAEALLATTLTAQIAEDPRCRAYVIGMNSVQTSMFACSPRVRQFFRNGRGQFTTLGEPPAWLVEFDSANSIENAYNTKWMAVDARQGAPPLRTLTYHPERPSEFLTLFNGSPLGQEAQFDLLGTLIEAEKLGQTNTTDFVCLIAGATEVLGYETGARSPLMRQLLLHLDRQIETLLNRLAKAPGEGNFAVVLAGAHGAPPLPAEDARARMTVKGEGVAQPIDKALSGANAGRVRRYLYPFLYLDPIVTRDPEAVRIAAGRAAMAHPAVAGFYTAGGYCSTHDAWETRYRNSFHPKRSGDVMLSYRPEYVEYYGQGRGISYGSLYNYDASVPLCFYGPQFRTIVFDAPVQSVDVAPTIARLLGVEEPSSSTGRVLSEAFAA
ncbi:MAG TPA: alkaline phosphatase family protein [Candidatus Acidoferrales bacterium]|nr:alkaline phosphatase family protein [Candidatus Acidoferrales bacterium]